MQKRPIILRSLLIEATPYTVSKVILSPKSFCFKIHSPSEVTLSQKTLSLSQKTFSLEGHSLSKVPPSQNTLRLKSHFVSKVILSVVMTQTHLAYILQIFSLSQVFLSQKTLSFRSPSLSKAILSQKTLSFKSPSPLKVTLS